MEQYLQDFENSRLVVYTIIVGDYDSLKIPEYIDENCDYICFTDNKELTSDIWQIRFIENIIFDNTRCQRMYKVLAHKFLPEYEYSLYVDGNVRIIGSLRDFIRKEWKGASLLGLKHPNRDNIYDEAEACIKFNKDNPEIIRKQIAHYKSDGYKADNGLTVTNVIFRKHNDEKLIKVMEDWWREIRDNSRRDQLSFCYVCWKNSFSYDISELKCYRSPYWMNPGIHTDNIRDVENELIDHIQLADYHQYLLNEKDKCIALKEEEKQELIISKEQEVQNIIALKNQEKEEAIALKEHELRSVIAYREQEIEKLISEVDIISKQASDLRAKIERMENTLSWRYTALFRKIFVKKDRDDL